MRIRHFIIRLGIERKKQFFENGKGTCRWGWWWMNERVCRFVRQIPVSIHAIGPIEINQSSSKVNRPLTSTDWSNHFLHKTNRNSSIMTCFLFWSLSCYTRTHTQRKTLPPLWLASNLIITHRSPSIFIQFDSDWWNLPPRLINRFS